VFERRRPNGVVRSRRWERRCYRECTRGEPLGASVAYYRTATPGLERPSTPACMARTTGRAMWPSQICSVRSDGSDGTSFDEAH